MMKALLLLWMFAAAAAAADYPFALLLRGSSAAAIDKEQAQKLQAGHMANINRMAEIGKLMAAGPMAENTDLRGIFVFQPGPQAEAEKLAAEDPAIQAGRLRMEWMTWHTRPGIGVALNAAFRQDPKTKMTMKVHYLALLRKGEAWAPGTNLKFADSKYLAAGAASGHAEVAAILVLNAASLEEAKAAVDAEPVVQSGKLRAEVRPWYVAAEVWQ